MPPRYAFCLEDLRVFHLVRELPCLRAQGRHSECGAAAGAAGIHAPDGAETASTLPQVRGEGQGVARCGISAAGLKFRNGSQGATAALGGGEIKEVSAKAQ